ncbi:MAG: tRNA pseudouridine synthase A, partial [Microbacteriaceae bacterium]
RIRLDLAYDGTAFAGWARQPGQRTVQGVLEDALATIFRRHAPAPLLTVAGRTDAGVHALGQVAHLDLDGEQLASLDLPHRPEAKRGPGGAEALRRRINGILGSDADARITAAAIAPEGFDARFSAVWRRYEYRVADGATPPNPLLRGHTFAVADALDAAVMDEAARALPGLHDWAGFCKPRDGATTIRTLLDFSWSRGGDGVLRAEVLADAFCHSMVRALVGASLAVGRGRLGPADLVRIRDAAARGNEFPVAAAKGLTLLEVGYPEDGALALRAAQTRGVRQLP